MQLEAPRERRPHSRIPPPPISAPCSAQAGGTTPSSRKINGPGVPVEAPLSTKTAALGPRGPAKPGSKPSRQGLESSPSSRAHQETTTRGLTSAPLQQGGTPLLLPSPAAQPSPNISHWLFSSTQAALRPQPGLTGRRREDEEGRAGRSWAGLGRCHELQQAPCSCDQRGETGLPICSCFPQQIISNSRTGRGLEETGESQRPSFLLTGVLFHFIISCCLLKGGQRRVPVWIPPHPSPSSGAGTHFTDQP